MCILLLPFSIVLLHDSAIVVQVKLGDDVVGEIEIPHNRPKGLDSSRSNQIGAMVSAKRG
jgi:hypothetical protein